MTEEAEERLFMSNNINTAYYNYYNIKGRYSPETPQTPAWKKRFEVVDDRIEGNNSSRDSDLYKAHVKLEEAYYSVSVSNRAKYKTEDEVRQAIGMKYSAHGPYANYSHEQRNAMYQNEVNMTLFGCLSGCNLLDPRIGGPVYGQTDEEVAAYNRKMVNTQIGNILSAGGIDVNLMGEMSFSIDPYTNVLTVRGVEQGKASLIEKLLNKDNNAKELFYHILQSNSERISDDVKTKYQAVKNFMDITGLNLRDFSQTKSGFINSDGKNALEIYKNALKTTSKVPAEFKGAVYEIFAGQLDKLKNTDFSAIPDMRLMIGYSEGKLQDSVFNNDIVKKLNVSV